MFVLARDSNPGVGGREGGLHLTLGSPVTTHCVKNAVIIKLLLGTHVACIHSQ